MSSVVILASKGGPSVEQRMLLQYSSDIKMFSLSFEKSELFLCVIFAFTSSCLCIQLVLKKKMFSGHFRGESLILLH